MMRRIVYGLLALGIIQSPAYADQRYTVRDGGEIACQLSLRDVTRISAVGDFIVTDVKRSASDPTLEFSVANEENRGDLYLSFQDGSGARRVSFFAITQKNFVYKFDCDVVDLPSQQIFIQNPTIDESEVQVASQDGWERLLAIGSALAEERPYPGFVVSSVPLEPQFVGGLKTQVIRTYTGQDMVGKALDITNVRSSRVTLREDEIKNASTIWLSLSDPVVEPGATVRLYVLERK
ncbi:MAG: hypothetical protein HC843_04485 [Sphingomonadales bacterium]|nr:hypothetical protein [Sphingomonadales bacterium]